MSRAMEAAYEAGDWEAVAHEAEGTVQRLKDDPPPGFRSAPALPPVEQLLDAAEHYRRCRDEWDGDTPQGEAAWHDAGHALMDLCARVAREGIA